MICRAAHIIFINIYKSSSSCYIFWGKRERYIIKVSRTINTVVGTLEHTPTIFLGKKGLEVHRSFHSCTLNCRSSKKMNLNRVRNLFSLDTTCFSLANAQKYSEGIKKRMAELQLLLMLPNCSVRVVIPFFFIHSSFSLCALCSFSSILSVDQT